MQSPVFDAPTYLCESERDRLINSVSNEQAEAILARLNIRSTLSTARPKVYPIGYLVTKIGISNGTLYNVIQAHKEELLRGGMLRVSDSERRASLGLNRNGTYAWTAKGFIRVVLLSNCRSVKAVRAREFIIKSLEETQPKRPLELVQYPPSITPNQPPSQPQVIDVPAVVLKPKAPDPTPEWQERDALFAELEESQAVTLLSNLGIESSTLKEPNYYSLSGVAAPLGIVLSRAYNALYDNRREMALNGLVNAQSLDRDRLKLDKRLTYALTSKGALRLILLINSKRLLKVQSQVLNALNSPSTISTQAPLIENTTDTPTLWATSLENLAPALQVLKQINCDEDFLKQFAFQTLHRLGIVQFE